MPPHEQKDMEKFIERKAKRLSRDADNFYGAIKVVSLDIVLNLLTESYSKGKEEGWEEVRKNCKECGTIYTCLCFNPKSAFYKGIK